MKKLIPTVILKITFEQRNWCFKAYREFPPWWYRNYHNNHNSQHAMNDHHWMNIELRPWPALSFNLHRKSVCSAVFTDFLEEKGHWSVWRLKNDFHDLFGTEKSREKGFSEIHDFDLSHKVVLANRDKEYYLREGEVVLTRSKGFEENEILLVLWIMEENRILSVHQAKYNRVIFQTYSEGWICWGRRRNISFCGESQSIGVYWPTFSPLGKVHTFTFLIGRYKRN